MATSKLSSEHAEQCAVFEWARYNYNLYPPLRYMFAIPNGAKLPYIKNRQGRRFAPQAIKLLQEGLRPGVADIFLPYPAGGFNGMFLEMKYGKNKPTEEQKEFLLAMKGYGYKTCICYSADDAIEELKKYFSGNN